MSDEVRTHGDQNSALLTFLAGTWTTRLTMRVDGFRVGNVGFMGTQCEGPKLRSLFEPLPDGGVAGCYMLTQKQVGNEEATKDSILRVKLNSLDNGFVLNMGGDSSIPGIKGVCSNSCVLFRDEFHDAFPMWEVFQAIEPQVTARPSTVSIIFHQASESSWLLDVAFMVQQSNPSQATPDDLRCRLEFWHFRERPSSSTTAHPQDLEESFAAVLQRCDDVTQDVEFRIDEIGDLITSLEESRSKCEEGLELLKELKSSAENGKNDVDCFGDDVQEAILGLHEAPSISAEGSAGTGGPKEILARALSELEGLQADAESLDADLDSIEGDVDFPEDLIGSVWTNAEYARGQRLLRENRDHLPPPDLSFLGTLEPSVSKLSKEATKIVETAVVLVQGAFDGELLDEPDYGPEIASMAKACERIIVDVIEEKKEVIERDPVFRKLLSDQRSWMDRIPAVISEKVNHANFAELVKKLVKRVKKSIETHTPIEWTGMGQKRLALRLFGGWIPVDLGGREDVLNPLGVNRSAELVQALPDRLSEFEKLRNGFVHHHLANKDDLRCTWECFQDCLKGLLQAFYAGSA